MHSRENVRRMRAALKRDPDIGESSVRAKLDSVKRVRAALTREPHPVNTQSSMCAAAGQSQEECARREGESSHLQTSRPPPAYSWTLQASTPQMVRRHEARRPG
eukprot:3751693-Pyramimonas_sp.AAC.1